MNHLNHQRIEITMNYRIATTSGHVKIGNVVVIWSRKKSAYEVYRVDPSGLEIFKGYRTRDADDLDADTIAAMDAEAKEHAEMLETQRAEREARDAKYAVMSGEELRAHFDAEIEARRAKNAARWLAE